NFNCTIQELKLEGYNVNVVDIRHFNCTIQELKLRSRMEGLTSPF
ncbi:hypothetical protein HMPREF1554_02184, partial [Porphyromonas gingivalis F0569]